MLINNSYDPIYKLFTNKWDVIMTTNEKLLLEKWLGDIKSGKLNPEFLSLGNDREKAIKKIQNQINNLR